MALQVPISFTLMEIVPDTVNGYFRTKPLRVEPGETIAHLRKLSAESFNKSSTDIQLVYYGKPLEDALTFEAAGIRNGSTVLVYPKIAPLRRKPQSRPENRHRILTGLSGLYKMKYLCILANAEFLRKIHQEMPDLDTGTLGILQTSRVLSKFMLPKHSKELDEVAEKYPLLGDILMKALEWAPSLLRVVPHDAPNQFAMETPSDESESESADDNTVSNTSSISTRIVYAGGISNIHSERTEPINHRELESADEPQPGPSRAPQQASRASQQPPRAAQQPVTNHMLQAALQAAYSSQAQVASETFGWQLGVMREMGFSDEKACIEALVRSGGDVDMAVGLLLQS